jgi:hypothetical protein
MAAALSAAANTILYLVELATGAIPWSMLSPGTAFPLNLQRVILVSVAAAVAGSLAFWAIKRVVSNAIPVFRSVAGLAFIVSLSAPFRISEATLYQSVAIALMHGVAAVSIIWALTIWGETGAGDVV